MELRPSLACFNFRIFVLIRQEGKWFYRTFQGNPHLPTRCRRCWVGTLLWRSTALLAPLRNMVEQGQHFKIIVLRSRLIVMLGRQRTLDERIPSRSEVF